MQNNGIIIDSKKLAELQKNIEKLPYCFKQYLKWIIVNKERIIVFSIKTSDELREQTIGLEAHKRTKEIINGLIIGFKILLMFMTENNVLTLEKSQELEKNMYIAFNELIEEQTLELEELNPVEMFYEAFEQLYISNTISIRDYETGRLFRGLNYTTTDVGFYNRKENQLYLFPDLIYSQVTDFYIKQGIKFPIPKRSFWTYMYNNGCLYRNPKQKRNDRKIRYNKIDYTVVAIENKNPSLFTIEEL